MVDLVERFGGKHRGRHGFPVGFVAVAVAGRLKQKSAQEEQCDGDHATRGDKREQQQLRISHQNINRIDEQIPTVFEALNHG